MHFKNNTSNPDGTGTNDSRNEPGHNEDHAHTTFAAPLSLKKDLRYLANLPEIKDFSALNGLNEQIGTAELKVLVGRFTDFFKHSEQVKNEKIDSLTRRQTILEEENLFHLDGVRMKNSQIETYKKENKTIEEKLKAMEISANQLRNSFEDQLKALQEKFESNKNNNSTKNQDDDQPSTVLSDKNLAESNQSSKILAKTLEDKNKEVANLEGKLAHLMAQLKSETGLREESQKLFSGIKTEHDQVLGKLAVLEKRVEKFDLVKQHVLKKLTAVKNQLSNLRKQAHSTDNNTKLKIIKEMTVLTKAFYQKKHKLITDNVTKQVMKNAAMKENQLASDWSKKLKEKDHEIKVVQEAVASKDTEIKNLSKGLADSKKEIKHLTQSAHQHEINVSKLNDILNQTKLELNTKISDLDKLTQDSEKKENLVSNLKKNISTLEALQKSKQDLERQRDISLQNWEKEKAYLEKTIAESKSKQDSIEKEAKVVAERLAERDHQIRTINNQLVEKTVRVSELEGQMKKKQTLQEQLEADIQAKQQEIKHIKEIEHKENQEVHTLRENLQKSILDLDNLEKVLEKKNKELDESCKAYDLKSSDLVKSTQQLAESKKSLENEKANVQARVKEIAEIIKSSSQKEKEFQTRLDKMAGEIEASSKKLKQSEDLLKSQATSLHAQLETRDKTIEDKSKELLKVQTSSEEKSKENDHLKKQILQKDEITTHLNRENENHRKNSEVLSKKLADAENKSKTLQGEVANLVKQVAALNNSVDTKEKETNTLKLNMQKEITEKDRLVHLISVQEQEIEGHKRLITHNTGESDALRQSHAHKDKEIEVFRNSLNKSENENKQKAKLITELEENIQREKRNSNAMEVALEKLNFEYDSLVLSLKQLERELQSKLVEEQKKVNADTENSLLLRENAVRIETLQKNFDEANRIITEKEIDINKLHNQIEKSKTSVNVLKQETEQLRFGLQEKNTLLAQKQAEAEKLIICLNDAAKNENQNCFEFENLKSQLLARDEKIDSMNCQVEALNSQIQDLLEHEHALNQEQSQTRMELDHLKNECIKKESELREEVPEVIPIQAKKGKQATDTPKIKELNKQIQNLEQNLAGLQGTLDERERQIAQLQDQINQQPHDVNTIQPKSELKDKEIKRLTNKISKLTQEALDLTKKKTTASVEIKKLQKTISALEGENAHLKEELEDRDHEAKNYNAKYKQVEQTLVYEMGELKAEIESFTRIQKKERDELLIMSAELKARDEEIYNFTNLLAKKNSELKKLEEKGFKDQEKKQTQLFAEYKTRLEKETKAAISAEKANFEKKIKKADESKELLHTQLINQIEKLQRNVDVLSGDKYKFEKLYKEALKRNRVPKITKIIKKQKSDKLATQIKDAKLEKLRNKLDVSVNAQEIYMNFMQALLVELEKSKKWSKTDDFKWESIENQLLKSAGSNHFLTIFLKRLRPVFMFIHSKILENNRLWLQRFISEIKTLEDQSEEESVNIEPRRGQRKQIEESESEEDDEDDEIYELKKQNTFLKTQNKHWNEFKRTYFNHYCCDGMRLCTKRRKN